MLQFLADNSGTVLLVVVALFILVPLRWGRGSANSRAPGFRPPDFRAPDFLAPWAGSCRGCGGSGFADGGRRTCGICGGSGSEPKGD